MIAWGKNSVTLVQLSHGVIDSILRKDVEFARRFFHTISVIIAGRLLKVAYQKTGSYVDEDMPLFITQQNSSASISNEGSSIFIKLHMDTSLILAEIPCKMRGKVLFNLLPLPTSLNLLTGMQKP